MKKSECLKVIKTAIFADGSVIKKVRRGKIGRPSSVFPCVDISCPIHEPFINQADNKKIPYIQDIDLLLFVTTQNQPDQDFDDTNIDMLVEYIKEKINNVSDGKNIIGVEWQHDEEFEGDSNSELGVTIYYKVQYRNAPIGR